MKNLRKKVAALLAAALCFTSIPFGAMEVNAEGLQFTEEQIAANDNVLYLVNAGTSDATVVPEGYTMGLYQSNVDQEYAVDAETGLSWGHEPNDQNSRIVKGGSGATSITGSYIYMSETVTFVKDVSGFKYKFELPERENQDYVVTIGVQNPWDSRNIDVKLEGETVKSNLYIQKSVLVEEEYQVKVTDGELNVMVHTPNRTSQYGDPVLSYIIVKAVPTYTIAALDAVITSYQERTEGHKYTEETKAAFDEVIAAAQALVEAATAGHEEIQQTISNIEAAYGALKEIYTYTSITGTNGARLFDNNGNKIQAHGGQIQKWGDTYYWYGEDKTNGYRPVVGVHLYTSKDLYNWTDEGVVLRSIPVSEKDYGKDQNAGYKADLSIFETDEYFKNLYAGYENMTPDDDIYDNKLEEVYWNLAEDRSVVERPKVLYNEETGKYVMWYHADGRTPVSDADYGKARAGVAISDSPTGPFKLLGTYILATGTTNHEWDDVGGHVRDMNVFCDDDGTAYVLYSSEGNTTMYIAELNDEYTGLVKDAEDMVYGEDFTIISTDSREAPAPFKYDGTYYLITSGCTGWAPNQARYTVATDLMGPWTVMGDPCVGDTAGTTFSTQSTCVFPVDAEAGKYIYMGDRWHNPDTGGDLSDSRYVWLPVEFGEGQTLSLKSYADWTLDELDGKGKIKVQTELPEEVGSITELEEALPATLDITVGGELYENTPVTWKVDSAKEALGNNAIGNITVSGTLTDIGREFSKDIFVYNENLKYLIDCSTGEKGVVLGSATYDKFAKHADLINKVSDQKYTEESGWGYTGVLDSENSRYDMGSKGSADFYNCGWWAGSNKSIDYTLTLEPGEYVVATGYQEWWSTQRRIRVTITSVDEEGNSTQIGLTNFTLKSTDQALQINTKITVPEDSVKVVIKVGKQSGSDSVLSWLGVIDAAGKTPEIPDTPDVPVYTDNLLVNGSFENGSEGWSLSNGQTIVEDAQSPDGNHYLSEDASKGQWGGIGTSQTVDVTPNTEYILTGTGKVDSNATYWVGANVDGREIYSVFSANAGYTDTTDTSAKYAYAVKAGASDWTDFEIRFTTGSSTSTVNIYTWVSGGFGYLDNLKLVANTTIDWTEFDAAVKEAEAKDKALYTADSWDALQKVVAEAKEFKAQATEATTKQAVDAMTKKLKAAMEALISVSEPTGNVTYYVDAENGDDSNDGTSPETAWKTLTKASSIKKLTEGGSILLKAGSVWNGEKLTVKNAEGTKENPIVIGSYGEGPKPVINGNGANWSYSTKEELAAVHIYNSQNIIVENLEITNWDATATGRYTYNQSSKLLSGLVVENRDAGELSNIVVRNNTIHDVNGLMKGGADKGAGGLMALVTGNGSNRQGITKSWYNGLTIEGNEVYKVCHEAIYMESVWANRALVGGFGNYQQAGASQWVGSSDVLIQNNYVHDVAGDGIVPINTTDALVQYNIIDNSADTSWNYSSNENHAALWTWDSNNVVFRYNEAFNTSKNSIGKAVGNDSMAFDFDYGVQNCLYEYNYSHDNLGGFLMLCPGPGATINNIARYNLSVNDGLYNGAPIIRLGTGKYGSIGVQIYNNTMYWADTGYSLALAQDSYWEGSAISNVSLFNNIFYGPATSGSLSTKSGVSYYNNLVYGGAENVYTANRDASRIVADPLFVDVKDYTSGSWSAGKTTLGTAEGFKLQADSPAIDAGAEHPEAPNYSVSQVTNELVPNTTEKPVVDYYGNALVDGKNDIGANEYTSEEAKELAIIEQPAAVSGEIGEDVVFTVKATGVGLSYQWQYSNAGSSKWYNSSMVGNQKNTVTVPVESYRDGQEYRCVVTDKDGNTVISEAAVMTVIVPEFPAITVQPEDYTGVIGEIAQFTVTAEGEGLIYQWQYSNAGSGKWYNSSMAGSDTDTIEVKIASYRDGQKYRCIITDEEGNVVTSEAAVMTVGVADDAPQITAQPESYAGAVGEKAVFTVEVEGEGLTYVWQYCNTGSTTWKNSTMKGNRTASLTVPVTEARDGQQYRCIITNAKGKTVTTEVVVLTVN